MVFYLSVLNSVYNFVRVSEKGISCSIAIPKKMALKQDNVHFLLCLEKGNKIEDFVLRYSACIFSVQYTPATRLPTPLGIPPHYFSSPWHRPYRSLKPQVKQIFFF